jgi:hypothetical protein
MELLVLIAYLVVVVGIISIERNIFKIRKLLEAREKREDQMRRVRDLEKI